MTARRRALLSVSDKTGLAELARGLDALGFELVSTGGTARAVAEAGVAVSKVAAVTGFPEILDGRVKTLHPAIHGGILADLGLPSHRAQLAEHGIVPIEVVVVNLYPFGATASRPGAGFGEVVEMIDIGGPCMVRAAAKNHGSVAVVVDPEDYPRLLAALEAGEVPAALRQELALKAFRHTRDYDTAIAAWLEGQLAAGEATETDAELERRFPRQLTVRLDRELLPRYGENPHQGAAVYRHRDGAGLFGGMEQLQGKELSWNNLLDADAARRMVAAFEAPAVVIVKHNNPCGVGVGPDLRAAYLHALETDPVSAFGSIIAVNGPVDGELAAELAKLFVEVVIAPGFDAEAREVLGRKQALRLLVCPGFNAAGAGLDLRSIDGGFLAQEADVAPDLPGDWTCPTRRAPTEAERAAMAFAWKVVRAVKSNAIVIANERQTVGIGAGQMSRVDSCKLAISKAQLPIAGCAAASDAFFPFRDGLDELAAAGVTAVIQPGGSKRDDEVVAAADEHGIALLHTGRRHFRH